MWVEPPLLEPIVTETVTDLEGDEAGDVLRAIPESRDRMADDAPTRYPRRTDMGIGTNGQSLRASGRAFVEAVPRGGLTFRLRG